jgi:hypothetical protein
MKAQKQSGRTAYPRLLAPVYFTRGALPWWWWRRRTPGGGVSVFTDERPVEGSRLRVEIFLSDGTTVTCRAAVAWVDALPDGAPARYDVGLDFVTLRPGDRERLAPVLATATR